MAELSHKRKVGSTMGNSPEPDAPSELELAAYYTGVADAMNVIRAYDFPFTERVDHIADELAPSVKRGGTVTP